MASRKAKAIGGGTIALGLLGAGALGWLLLGGSKDAVPESGPTPAPGTPGPTTPADVLIADWCSAKPGPPPPALDKNVVEFVMTDPEHLVPLLWLQLALNVTGWSPVLPTVDSLKASRDNVGKFDADTQAALSNALGYRVGADKPADILAAYRGFKTRDVRNDRPCPVSVPAALNTALANATRALQILADTVTPPPPPPPPAGTADWCSSIASDTYTTTADPDLIASATETTDPLGPPELRLSLLWLMIALYVMRKTSVLPDFERINASVIPNEYDPQTTQGLQRLLPGRTLGVDKNADILEAYRAFRARDRSLDRACPITVPDAVRDALVLLTGRLQAAAGA